jgi:hypothetical protein
MILCAILRCAVPVLQVVQAVNAQYFQETQTSVDASNIANFFITGPSCPTAPPGYILGSQPTPASSPASTSTGDSAKTPTAVPVPASNDSLTAPPSPGLSVVLSAVQAQRSAAPVWDLSMQPVANETAFTAGTAGVVNYKLSWNKLKQVGWLSSCFGLQCWMYERAEVKLEWVGCCWKE